jgi:pilus assembly protein Flp/PilA
LLKSSKTNKNEHFQIFKFVIYLIQVLNIEQNKNKKIVGGNKMLQKIKNLVVEEEGQGLSEYGLILAGVVVLAVAAVGVLTGALETLFDDIAALLEL